MRRTPRRVAAAMAVMMTYLSTTVAAVAGPVATGMILAVREERCAVVLRPGQYVMLIGLVAATFDAIARLVEGCFQGDGFVVKV